MNTNGTIGSGSAARYQAPVECRTGTGNVAFFDLEKRHGTAGTDPTDSRERAALMQAFTAANMALARAQEPLGTTATSMLGTFRATQTSIDAAERFALGDTSSEAQQQVDEVRKRHVGDGPESLRRPPKLWRRLLWPTMLASLSFDTMFVGTMMQRFFGLDWHQVGYYLAYFPGLGLALCLLAAGSMLAESIFRWRTRTSRASERPRLRLRRWGTAGDSDPAAVTEQRAEDGLPWPKAFGPVVFTLLLFAVIVVWSQMRAEYAVHQHLELAPYRNAVAIVTVVLSTAAVVVKVLAHNPFADRDEEARKSVDSADERLTLLVAGARERLAEHTAAWHRLRSSVELTAADAYRTVEEACAGIVEERARSGTAGQFTLPLTEAAWPWPQAKGDTGGTTARPPTAPALRLGLLRHFDELLDRYAPGQLEDRLEHIVRDLNSQFEHPGRPLRRPTAADAEPAQVEEEPAELGEPEEPAA
ncbi:hypothetical protein ACEZDB_26135 [Streptacidiphilus sp. N1-3]|uniref:DUF4129 domain-containing protein n=1 Tax=Streptacidiphilus alkalitolerans TaxID=3342712 RepID=A0ABV6X759_9ACTN